MIKNSSYQHLNNRDVIECPVCLEKSNKYYISPCKHSWCNKCNMNPKFERKCPICRICVPLSPKSRKKVEYKKKRKEIERILFYSMGNGNFSIGGLGF